MNRETKTITTPSGQSVVIKTYLTAREALPVIEGKELSDVQKSTKLAEAAIVSIDGAVDNLTDRFLDMKLSDYTAVLKEITGLISDLGVAK